MEKSKNEKINNLLYKISDKAIDDLISQYPSLDELDGKYEFSNEHKRRMKKIFNKQKQKGFPDLWVRVRKFAFNSAAVICILFTLFTLTAFTLKPLRLTIMNYFLEKNDEYTMIKTTTNENTKPTHSSGMPEYIPHGYEMLDISEREFSLKVTYINDNMQFIRYERREGDIGMVLDTEDSQFEKIDINGSIGYVNIKNNMVMLIFHNEKYTYSISSQTSLEETIKIAESIIN